MILRCFGRSFYAATFVCATISAGFTQENVPEAAGPVIDIVVGDSAQIPAASIEDSLPPIDSMPVLTAFVNAQYPPLLLKKGVAGTVVLELLVSEAGTVDSVSVKTGIAPELDSAAARAARKFQFTPARAAGEAVAVMLEYAYTFSLENAQDTIKPVTNFAGQCIEKGTKRPIPDAVVSISFIDTLADTTLPLPFSAYLKKICAAETQQLDNGHIIAMSDDSGRFVFTSLPACSIRVAVAIPGYAVFKSKEVITKNELVEADYYIERHTYSDYEITVYGKAEEKSVSRRQLTINEIRKIPGFGGDAIKAVQVFPGVSRKAVGSGEVIVRGAPTWDTRFFIDGMELPLLYHFGELKSTYNSEGLSSIDFFPGGFGTRYGGAVAGIVEIKGRKGTSERLKATAELSTVDGSFFVEGPIKDSSWTFMVNARRSFIGDVINLIFKMAPEQFPFTMYPYYWDYLARSDLSTKKWGSFYVSLFGSRDSLRFTYPKLRFGSDEVDEHTDRIGMNQTFHTGVAGWNIDLGKQWNNALKYNLMSIFSNFTSPFMKNRQELLVNHVRDELTFTVSPQVRLVAGADLQFTLVDFYGKFILSDNAAFPVSRKNWLFGDIAGFFNMEWKPVEALMLVPGIRYDYYPELSYDGSIAPEFWDYKSFNNERGWSGEPSVRLNGKYTFLERHTAKFALGTYNQSPEPQGQSIIEEFGDPKMPATKAAHYVAGYEWRMTDLLDLDAQVYLNRQWDIPRWTSDADLTDDAVDQPLMNHSGLGRMYGFELMVRHQQSTRFFGWLSYTLARSERSNVIRPKWKVYSEDETHYLQVVGSWKLPKNFEAGFHVKLASGKPTTIVLGIYEEDENTPGAQSIIPKMGKYNAGRMEPAFQLDLRIDKKIVANKSMLTLFADLQNIGWFFYKTSDEVMYGPFYDEKQMFSMFPMFALGAKFEY